jgi:hypothetical protein
MFFERFANITRRFPEEREALQRLAQFLEAARPESEFTLQRLYAAAQPSSTEVLALILNELTNNGVLRRAYKVVSRSTGGGIQEYRSLRDVPDRVEDIYTGEEIEAGPDNIKPVFRVA